MNKIPLISYDLELIVSLGLNAASALLILALSALGLAIIFGFMGVINLAHGAFFTIGAYVVWFISGELGLGFWPGFVLAPIVVGIVGLLVETMIIQHLYDRLLDTILATWGVALVITEGIKILVNAQSKGVQNPLPGGVDIFVATYSMYRLFLMGVSIVTLISVFLLFTRTNLVSRRLAGIQDPKHASLLCII
jgi:branched-chain amino acid transport system permease protein/urea transport system permease protein